MYIFTCFLVLLCTPLQVYPTPFPLHEHHDFLQREPSRRPFAAAFRGPVALHAARRAGFPPLAAPTPAQASPWPSCLPALVSRRQRSCLAYNPQDIESKKEDFRKYLEQGGVIDALTKSLVGLYEESEKPTDALAFIQQVAAAPS